MTHLYRLATLIHLHEPSHDLRRPCCFYGWNCCGPPPVTQVTDCTQIPGVLISGSGPVQDGQGGGEDGVSSHPERATSRIATAHAGRPYLGKRRTTGPLTVAQQGTMVCIYNMSAPRGFNARGCLLGYSPWHSGDYATSSSDSSFRTCHFCSTTFSSTGMELMF